jgi:alpha-glucosidase (family GH31 glycosyl hydrolase)
VGNAFKVSPVLEEGVETYESYFPNGRWVSMKNHSQVVVVNDPSGGKSVMLEAPNDTVNVHLMPGAIAVVQDNKL